MTVFNRKPSAMAGAYPCWTDDDDAQMREACAGRTIRGKAAWQKVADGFPGRSYCAVRQHWLELRNKDAGIIRDRTGYVRPARERKRKMPRPTTPERLPVVNHQSITAAHFGDPSPGRSALDDLRRQADVFAGPFLSDMLPRRNPLDQMRAGLA